MYWQRIYFNPINNSGAVFHDFLNNNLLILSWRIESIIVTKIAYISLFNKEKYDTYKDIKKNMTQNRPFRNSE